MEQNKIACVFGGTGFVGRQVVRELAKVGYTVKIATRVPERAYFLKPCGAVGQVVPVQCHYNDGESITQAIKGCDVVVNCIGLLHERRRGDFTRAHVDVPAMISAACAKKGVERFVHISALGVDVSQSRYAKTKHEGEKAILANFPNATLLRPSVIFGDDDDFFNKFARMAEIAPALPLIGGGHTKFQPVFVGDVADAVMQALTLCDMPEGSPKGCVYELGGPEVLTFKGIYQRLFRETQRRRALINIPFGLMKIPAFFFSVLPKPPLTCDQIESLKSDSIVTDGALTLADLGVQPTSLDTVLPHYLLCYKKGGRFADTKA